MVSTKDKTSIVWLLLLLFLIFATIAHVFSRLFGTRRSCGRDKKRRVVDGLFISTDTYTRKDVTFSTSHSGGKRPRKTAKFLGGISLRSFIKYWKSFIFNNSILNTKLQSSKINWFEDLFRAKVKKFENLKSLKI